MKVHKSQVRRMPPKEKTYPGVGLLICLTSGLAFWGSVAYLVMK